MAYDEGLAQIFRDDLAAMEDIAERKMFGGLAFLWRGHMLCGVHSGGGMVRVGKENHAAALDLPGVAPMAFTGRPMGGFVELDDTAMSEEATRLTLLDMARSFAETLPPK